LDVPRPHLHRAVEGVDRAGHFHRRESRH
jgi:hypothetical protein